MPSTPAASWIIDGGATSGTGRCSSVNPCAASCSGACARSCRFTTTPIPCAASFASPSGSIGYADDSQAGDLSKASIKVSDAYVAPSAEGAAIALAASPLDDTRDEGDLAIKVDRTTTEANAYPLFLASYLIACPTYKDKDTADTVKNFLTYIVSSDGQKAAADSAGSAPLPDDLAKKATDILSKITAG